MGFAFRDRDDLGTLHRIRIPVLEPLHHCLDEGFSDCLILADSLDSGIPDTVVTTGRFHVGTLENRD